jgi:hypothetical protein
MRSRIGRVSRVQLGFLALVAATVVTGMLVARRVGFWMQVVGWGILAIAIVLKVGIVTNSSTDERSPRHY